MLEPRRGGDGVSPGRSKPGSPIRAAFARIGVGSGVLGRLVILTPDPASAGDTGRHGGADPFSPTLSPKPGERMGHPAMAGMSGGPTEIPTQPKKGWMGHPRVCSLPRALDRAANISSCMVHPAFREAVIPGKLPVNRVTLVKASTSQGSYVI